MSTRSSIRDEFIHYFDHPLWRERDAWETAVEFLHQLSFKGLEVFTFAMTIFFFLFLAVFIYGFGVGGIAEHNTKEMHRKELATSKAEGKVGVNAHSKAK